MNKKRNEHGTESDQLPSDRLEKQPKLVHKEKENGSVLDDKKMTNHVELNRRNFVDITNLIRSIQRAEGGEDCFLRRTNCEIYECAWRVYCLKKI